MFYTKEISEILEKSIKDFKKSDIYELAMYDPHVHCVLKLHESGHLTWEQSLIYCILLLSKAYSMSLERLFMTASEPRYEYLAKDFKK